MQRPKYAALSCLAAACVVATPSRSACGGLPQDSDRAALIAALEGLMSTGEPRHTDHDAGQWLQLAVDEAIARGDREIEKLAIRAAAPLVASVSRPLSSTYDPLSIGLNASTVLGLKTTVPYTAQVYGSFDHGEFVHVATVRSGKEGRPIDTGVSKWAALPGIHVLQLKANLTFAAAGQPGATASWTEYRTLQPVVYGRYDPVADSSAPFRALVFGPASTPVRQLDPLLGNEPFAAWLSGLLSTRRTEKDSAPDWISQYCDERTGEAGARSDARAVCAVVYFQVRGEIGQVWFRTAERQDSERGPEWVQVIPPRFEGMMIRGAAPDSRRLSLLPSLLDGTPSSRPTGDLAISPDDIVFTTATAQPGGTLDVTFTVRNLGDGDLHKAMVHVAFGTDVQARGTRREFVVDIPAHESIELRLQAGFPAGYGFVMAHGLQWNEHSPHDNPVPDSTPENACAFRVVNARLAPATYLESILAASSGSCSGK